MALWSHYCALALEHFNQQLFDDLDEIVLCVQALTNRIKWLMCGVRRAI